MASHGIPRTAVQADRSVESRQKELKDIVSYKALVDEVNENMQKKEYTPKLLQKTADLLQKNPEYYTIWNHRRRIYVSEFIDLARQVSEGRLSEDERISQVLSIIELDLQFLFPLLLKFPKCYWIWNHRLWLLEQSSLLLPASKAERIWTEELVLVSKMLARDNRNFHGWSYRRIVIANLETFTGNSMAKSELGYTTKMISSNLSNFSAWHNRSKLILRILDEQHATDEERKQMLDEELKLIHNALIDPYDQSLWFYHQNLRCTFDPHVAHKTMAPNLSNDQRRQYVIKEREFVEELLEDADDCKWIYQTLIELRLLDQRLAEAKTAAENNETKQWLEKLMQLDPLRKGRWEDLQKSVLNAPISGDIASSRSEVLQ